MPIIYVALGSNMGDREERVLHAVHKMRTFANVKKISTLGETEAEGPCKGQPKFINAVVELDTAYEPEEVLDELLQIEEELGRNIEEKSKNMPREIDLDLIVYGNEIVKTDRLTIPHPRMTERQFVIAPLAELNPKWIHPETGESIQDLLKKFPS
ncbi:MAG: 2-amino-4-hydroxy-6-hydroxymethyldihydropteridine diphosphokinase [Bdellovibrionota bacterium]